MNGIFEVLTWEYYDKSHEGSEIQDEWGFKTIEEAYTKYEKTKVSNGGKMLMKYESLDPDSDGDVIEEFWT